MKVVFENCINQPKEETKEAVEKVFSSFLNRVDSYGVKSHHARYDGYTLYMLFSHSEREVEKGPLRFFIRDDGLLELDCGSDRKNLILDSGVAQDPVLFMMSLTSAFARRLPQGHGRIVWANTANELFKRYNDSHFSLCGAALLPSKVHDHNSQIKGRDLMLPDGVLIPHLG